MQILDLPDWYLTEPRTYADFVRYLAKRGEFGAVDPEAELRRFTENAGRQWTAERTRPDGRVLEVRHNPVPGGGFVLIYGDISERKRSEEQIRAARAAALSSGNCHVYSGSYAWCQSRTYARPSDHVARTSCRRFRPCLSPVRRERRANPGKPSGTYLIQELIAGAATIHVGGREFEVTFLRR